MRTVKFNQKTLPKDTTDWKALDKLTDEEVEQRALSDPDGVPLTEEDFKRLKRSPRVRIIRMALGMTQEEFSEGFGIPIGTLRDWEQGRRRPDQAVQSYLKVIGKHPDLVKRILSSSSAKA